MPYAVEFYFDRTTETALHQLWQAIAETGVKSPMLEAGYRPHISLAVYDNDNDALDVESLQQDLTAYAETVAPFELVLSNIGIFPTVEGVVFLGVTVTQKLLEIHTNFHHTFERYAEHLRPYYEIGKWVPHCTLSFGLSAQESIKIIAVSWGISWPVYSMVQEIGLTKVSPTRCKPMLCCSLSGH